MSNARGAEFKKIRNQVLTMKARLGKREEVENLKRQIVGLRVRLIAAAHVHNQLHRENLI